MPVLSRAAVDSFVEDGVIKIPQAFPRSLADRCRALLWDQLGAEIGAEPGDPASWTRPAHRIAGSSDAPFQEAATTERLHAAFDQLVGAGRWTPRRGLGTFPIRFPHPDSPSDTGWHVEASFTGDTGEPRLNVRSRGRALLMLFLFSEVTVADAPTMVRLGSHRATARLLAPYGDAGAEFFAFAGEIVPATEHLPAALATGEPGDVWLVHPFTVHSGQPHGGTRPRFMAQPPLDPTGPLRLDGGDPTPVETPVRAVLAPRR